ncbi:hypothetical protein [Companilactobacillus baiquanensis]|uniref:Uncharacterized protein n=1 Tax=Companilactobacillus baiquanensis TaxID=2486005 RepID=A0ABW1UTW5_9LACO|nr:hypothetical protein [Companilactobacillus baiquanensis]
MDNKNNSAFSTIDENIFKPIQTSDNENSKTVEHEDVFAKGLPDWDLVPDNILVRRHQ